MNKQGGHTPGPWTVGHPNLQDDAWFHRIFFSDNRGMYEVAVVDKRKRPGADGDARLIAAAPEMLEVLDVMARLLEYNKGHATADLNAYAEKARGIIAKARGGV